MTLSPVTALPSSNPPTPQSNTAPALQSDYMTFLRMLTTQMQNQDPLNPTEASDFAVQLATFAGVEQATQTNQLLTALLTRSGLADLGGWVGMQARVLGGAWFDGRPLDLAPDPVVGADAVTLIARDAQGAIVDSRALDPGAQSYAWDGRSDGRALPPGRYTFEIESRRGTEVLATHPVAAFVEVREARIEGGQTYLVMPGGLVVEAGQITGLRQPPGPDPLPL